MNKSYTFKRFLLFAFTIFYFSSFAAWLNFVPQTITQPDGIEFDCFATGDEFYNWLHDAEGFTIIQNHNDGFYYFAELSEGKLVPTDFVAGSINPATVGLTSWANISNKEMQAIRADFIKNKMPEKPQLPGFTSPKDIKNEGILNNLVVYIRFSDQNEFPEDTMQYYNMFNNTNFGYNSMQNYFETVSYNKISIPSWFYPQPSGPYVLSYQDTYPRSYFMPYDAVTNPNGYQSGQSGEREHALLKRACLFIQDEVPQNLNLDKNNDGYIDNMVFIVRGATTAWATLLWPHRWALYGETVYINGKRVWDYNLQVEEHLNGSGAGVLCHEMFHSLSAPDLYHYSSAPFTSVGPWDLMDNANNPPESMGAYMKYRYGGWIDEIPEITECGTYTLNPLSEPENNCFKIASPNSNNEYFVLEYRVKKGIFENSIPGTGLLVYRIDNTLSGNGNAQGPPDEVYVYRPGGNTSTNGDLGLAHFAADYNRTEINDNTDPFPFLQNGQAGGLIISNVGYIGETISFDVYFEKAPVAQFETQDTLITEGCIVDFYDLSVCEVESWEWVFEGGTPSTSTEQNPMGIIFENAGYYNVSLKVTNLWGEDEITKTSLIHVCDITCPQINFYASDSVICSGAIVQLSDFSKVCPESWNWEISPNTFSFINGTNASTQNPEVQFTEVGEYTVSLTVTNTNGSSNITKDGYIKAGGVSVPFFEDFESGSPDGKGWAIVNPDNDAITWDIFPVSGNEGSYSAGINLFEYYSIFKRDQLISPPLDLSGLSNAILSFEHAYAQAINLQYTDSLIVKISSDCGESWTRIIELGEDGSQNFTTHSPINYNFFPAVQEDWCGSGFGSECYHVDISQWAGNTDVQIMFESVRMVGNNLFIDNVSVGIFTGNPLPENDEKHIEIFPNPSSGIFNVSFQNFNNKGDVLIFNPHGQLIKRLHFNAELSGIQFDLQGKPKGLYLVKIQSNSLNLSKKIMLK